MLNPVSGKIESLKSAENPLALVESVLRLLGDLEKAVMSSESGEDAEEESNMIPWTKVGSHLCGPSHCSIRPAQTSPPPPP